MIPTTYLRSSSYLSHEMCPMKYFAEYVLGWTSPTGKNAAKGTIVHKVLEIMAHMKLAEQNNKASFADEVFGEMSRDSFFPDDFTEVVYNHYIKSVGHHFWGPADLRQCIRWVKKALEFNDGKMNPFNQDIIMPEQYFDIEIKSDWGKYEYEIYNQDTKELETVIGRLKLKGTIDLITRVNQNTNEIIDYKCGMRKNWVTGEIKEYEDFFHDFQLRLYHYAHTLLYPDIPNVLVTIYYINKGGPFTISLGQADISDTLDMIRAKFEEVRDTEKPKVRYGPPCKFFCHLGKETFEDTHIISLDSNEQCKLSKPGNKMCKCDQLRYTFENRDMNSVIDNMTKKNHKIDNYQAPGET